MPPKHRQLREVREPVFDEQWVAGTYLISGIFFFDSPSLTSAVIADAINPLYERTKKQRRRAWPRGVSGYYIIPIFTAPSFDDQVVNFVHVRMTFRWAIWPEPVLYRSADNTVEQRADYGLHGAAFYYYVQTMIGASVGVVAKLAGYKYPCAVNGHPIQPT
jgi:hypothetical protein